MTRAARSARLGLVAVLAIALSGVPGAVFAAMGHSKCERHCEEASDRGCSPTCADGACGRTVAAALNDVPESGIAESQQEQWDRGQLSPPEPPVVDGVFHPPTR